MVSTLTQRPPKTLIEVFKSLPEGTLAQLIENRLVMTPSPSDIHQKVSVKISDLFYNYIEVCKSGELRVAPYDVFLDEKMRFSLILFLSIKSACT